MRDSLPTSSATTTATGAVDPDLRQRVRDVLRGHGARFAFLHGSRATGTARPGSDVDVAAWFGRRPVDDLAVRADLPGVVDPLVLDHAPLELAGRVALHGELLLDDDPPRRVAWQAHTRKLYLDERPRVERARRDFARAFGGAGRARRAGAVDDAVDGGRRGRR